jgi:ABC-type multidrug transport system ATPase subunit
MKLEACNLAKRFNREWIFRRFDYTFEPGKIYAITGPNGSGKSTLLRILWGQLPATSGDVKYFVNGQVPLAEVYREVAIATPYMELVEEFKLEEMVDFHFKFKKPAQGMTRANILDRLDLRAGEGKAIASFSSGMKQRLKLGLAFFASTPFLFLDEPSTNLDARSLAWYRALLDGQKDRLVVIASNQPHEYPENAVQIDIQGYK